MSAITLSQAEAQLAVWLTASTAVASGQSVDIGDKKFTMANAAEIRRQIQFWNNMVRRLGGGNSGGIGVYGATPVDN